MQETVGVVSSASALVIPPFCKLSQPCSFGLGSTRRWTSAVLGARSRASTLLVARDAGRIPTVGDFSRQHRATRPKGCGASRERGWVFSFRHTLSNLGQQTCNYIPSPTCQPYLSCDHIFSSGETDRRSRVIIMMKQRFSRTHRRPVARGKVNELGRASIQARRASVPRPPSSALQPRFHRAISARFPRDHADASRRAYADASWRGHVPGSTNVPGVPARRE